MIPSKEELVIIAYLETAAVTVDPVSMLLQ
jgi:hypothetical protein